MKTSTKVLTIFAVILTAVVLLLAFNNPSNPLSIVQINCGLNSTINLSYSPSAPTINGAIPNCPGTFTGSLSYAVETPQGNIYQFANFTNPSCSPTPVNTSINNEGQGRYLILGSGEYYGVSNTTPTQFSWTDTPSAECFSGSMDAGAPSEYIFGIPLQQFLISLGIIDLFVLIAIAFKR